MPSDSIGFWVAMTRNGEGNRWATPSAVVWRSCMASSSAACVLAGARLISSASTSEAKIGPSRKCASRVVRSSTVLPVMSAGSTSGVNCTREYDSPAT